METVAEPGACVPGRVTALPARDGVLRADGAGVEQGMRILELVDHRARIGLDRRVQRDDDRRAERQRLQPVDEVRHRHRPTALGIVGGEVVPRGPGALPARQQRGIGVQHDAIRLVAHLAEQPALVRGRVREERKRLVAVAGEHHAVEAFAVPRRRIDLDTARAATYLLHRAAEPDVGEPLDDLLHVDAPAALHGAPLRPVVDREQPVVVAEADERRQREVENVPRRRRPDRGGHRHEVAVPERPSVASRVEERAERRFRQRAGGERRGGLAIEAQDVREHRPERGGKGVRGPREQRREVRAGPLEAAAVVAYRERHLGGHARHAELGEQVDQVRVRAVVEHQEAGVHRVRDVVERHVDGVRMSARTRFGLEHGDRVPLLLQEPRGAQPGDARADDRKSQGPDGMVSAGHVSPEGPSRGTDPPPRGQRTK